MPKQRHQIMIQKGREREVIAHLRARLQQTDSVQEQELIRALLSTLVAQQAHKAKMVTTPIRVYSKEEFYLEIVEDGEDQDPPFVEFALILYADPEARLYGR